jgi:D-alanyl-lipoteichoic acid acyltransferase DltB (MBOAT superfamily)
MYRAQNHLTISAETIETARFNNQIVFNSGDTNPTLIVPKGIVFIDFLQASLPVSISDGDGDLVSSSISSIDMTYTPLRVDHGFTITGTVDFLRCFVIEGVLAN